MLGRSLIQGMFHLLILVIAGCSSPLSELSIDNGTHIDHGGNTVISVVQINTNGSSCTGQAVSLNTMITAGHCVENSSQPRTCIVSGANRGTCSSNVYIPQEYLNKSNNIHFAYDMAVVVFDEPIFEGFFGVRHQEDYVQAGEQFYMVGYSNQNATVTSAGSKNWGQNTIDRLLSENITIESDGDGGNTVSPGDSGGGAFTSCQLIGVASRYTGTATPGVNKNNLHTNLLWEGNFDYMQDIKSLNTDAYICGLHGWDEANCPLDKVFFPDLNPATDEFVCTSISQERG